MAQVITYLSPWICVLSLLVVNESGSAFARSRPTDGFSAITSVLPMLFLKIDAQRRGLTEARPFSYMRPHRGKPPNFSPRPAVRGPSNSQGGLVNITHLKISAAVAAMALIVPAGAAAKRPEDRPAKAKTPKAKLVTANVTGVVVSNDGSTLVVTVGKASGQAKACKGKDLTFDISKARVHTADND